MLIASESIETCALPETVWALWRDVGRWNAWDPEVAWSQLEGAFARSARGVLKPIHGPRARFVITDCVAGQAFVSETQLPLARLVFSHSLDAAGGATRICHRIEVYGPLARVFGALLGKGLSKGLPLALRNLVRLAEEREAADVGLDSEAGR